MAENYLKPDGRLWTPPHRCTLPARDGQPVGSKAETCQGAIWGVTEGMSFPDKNFWRPIQNCYQILAKNNPVWWLREPWKKSTP